MSTELSASYPALWSGTGVVDFPAVACAASPVCPTCADCVNDCVDCAVCVAGSCAYCEPPDLTPRTANMLVVAGVALAAEARQRASASPRRSTLLQLAWSLDHMQAALARGERPVPGTMAEQLCLHLMISYATDVACAVGELFATGLPWSDYDYYFDRLYDTVLADDEHLGVIRQAEMLGGAGRFVDLDILAAVVATDSITGWCTPFGAERAAANRAG